MIRRATWAAGAFLIALAALALAASYTCEGCDATCRVRHSRPPARFDAHDPQRDGGEGGEGEKPQQVPHDGAQASIDRDE